MAEKLIVSGARGASVTEMARITGAFGASPSDDDVDVMDKFAQYAIEQNPGFKSDIPGPANSTYTSLALLKSAPATNVSYIFAPPGGAENGVRAGTFLYQTAGKPYTADGVNVIKLDAVPLTTGALVRQGADSLTARRPTLTAANVRRLSEKTADTFDLRDVLGFQTNSDNDMTGEVQIGMNQSVSDKTEIYFRGGGANVNNLYAPDGVQLIGAGKGLSQLKKIPDVTKPLIRTRLGGVTQHSKLSGLTFGGNDLDGETLLLYDGSSAAPGTNVGTWYTRVESCQFLDPGGKGIFLLGGSDEPNADSNYQQFITFADVMCLRSRSSKYSRAFSAAGNVGQIYFEGHCQFDTAGQGNTIAEGFNINASRVWKNTDGRRGDAADAYLENFVGWSPVSDLAPYHIQFGRNVTTQGSKRGIMIDRAEADVSAYFENIEGAVTVMGSAFAQVFDATFRNAAGSASSGGMGFMVDNRVARVLVGKNKVKGFVDRSYIGTDFLQYNRIAPDESDFDMSSVSSNMTRLVGVSGTSINFQGNDQILVNGGSASSPAAVGTLTGTLGPSDVLTMVVNNGSLIRLAAGGNISLPSNEDVILRGGDSVTFVRRDLGTAWTPISVVRRNMYASAAPTSGYYGAGEIVRQANRGPGVPMGWQAIGSGSPPTFATMANYQ